MKNGFFTNGPAGPIRIVVVDDQISVREMLALLLSQETNFSVVGEARTGWEALEVCTQFRPEMAIIDLTLPELSGVEVLRRMRNLLPATRLMVYSGTTHAGLAAEALWFRPHGYVHKRDPLHVLREAIRAVADGRNYFSTFAAELMEATRQGSPLPATLGEREREVLQLVAEGWRTKEIASRLGISVKTAENHRAHLMLKLGLNGVAALTRYAVKLGLVEAG